MYNKLWMRGTYVKTTWFSREEIWIFNSKTKIWEQWKGKYSMVMYLWLWKWKVALGYDLNHGRTTTCGCKNNISQKPSKKRIDLTGKVFGNLKVISIDTKNTKQCFILELWVRLRK